jgi:chemotaxis protein methyltransferase CheR
MERGRNIPPSYLQRFCRKGGGTYDGMFLIERSLRSKLMFRHMNLNTDLPHMGSFDFVFLRNVMIYFNKDTQREVVKRVTSVIKPGGYFCIGHSESLNEVNHGLTMVAPTIYQKPV